MVLRKAIAVIGTISTLFLSCSTAPKEIAKKEPEKAAEAVGGRYAFHQTYISARTWATDLEVLRVRNNHVENAPPAPGKAAVWEVTFVSPTKQRSKTYTYSVIEQQPIHK